MVAREMTESATESSDMRESLSSSSRRLERWLKRELAWLATEPLRCATRDASIGALGADVRWDDAKSAGVRGRSPERTIARDGTPAALSLLTGDQTGSGGLEARGGVRPVGTEDRPRSPRGL